MTYRVRFLCEGVHKDPQQFVSIVDLVSILSDDPYQGRLGFRLVELIKVSAQRWDDTLVCRRVFAEDVLVLRQ